MNPELQQLKDIHLPQAISFWPPAPGWVILITFILILFVYTLHVWYKHKKEQYPIKFALKQLKKLDQMTTHNPENVNIAAEISLLLRRTALHYFPREMIAGLTGQAWLKFLIQHNTNKQSTIEVKHLLNDAPYQKNTDIDLQPLFAFAQTWLVALSKNKIKIAEKY